MNEAEFFNVELDESLKAGGDRGAVTFAVAANGGGTTQNGGLVFCLVNDSWFLRNFKKLQNYLEK